MLRSPYALKRPFFPCVEGTSHWPGQTSNRILFCPSLADLHLLLPGCLRGDDDDDGFQEAQDALEEMFEEVR